VLFSPVTYAPPSLRAPPISLLLTPSPFIPFSSFPFLKENRPSPPPPPLPARRESR